MKFERAETIVLASIRMRSSYLMREAIKETLRGHQPSISRASSRGMRSEYRSTKNWSPPQGSSVLNDAHQCSSGLIRAHRAQARRVKVGTGGDERVLGLRLEATARDGACNREHLMRGALA